MFGCFRAELSDVFCVSQAGTQSLSNGDVAPAVLAQSFSTPPSRRSLPPTSTASFSSLHSVSVPLVHTFTTALVV